jgi:outer membrane protein assembly factor BamB
MIGQMNPSWLLCVVSAWVALGGPPAGADPQASPSKDWPMWRRDAGHTGATVLPLADRLQLQWTRELPPLQPGWKDQPRVQLDAVYEPVVLGRTMFVPSARHDSVTAYDTRSGEEKWVYFADGPVRYSPVAWEGRVYFASDDGFLTCLDAEKGGLVWKFRGGPSDRRILGNERLISTWPARGAPVIADGVVYFAAGIWPFMGIFIHALDARSGNVVWTNEGDGSIYMMQPHNVDSFAGIAPQGPMSVSGDRLLISGGRSVPACYDRKTGKLLYFKFADNGRRGGSDVATLGGLFFAGGLAYDLTTGFYAGEYSRALTLSSDLLCSGGKKKDLLISRMPAPTVVETVDRKGGKMLKTQWKLGGAETVEMPMVTCLLRAGGRIYAGSEKRLTAFQIGTKTKEAWRMELAGTPASLLAADDRLFVITREGQIQCYGAEPATPAIHAWKPAKPEASSRDLAWGVGKGYALFLGAPNPSQLRQVAESSELRIIAFAPDAGLVEKARRDFVAAGIPGERLAIHVGDSRSVDLPPYVASLIVCEDATVSKETLKELYGSLRPYGGRLWCKSLSDRDALEKAALDAGLVGATFLELADGAGSFMIVRSGPLPGAGSWTHEHADAANTRVSKDTIVRAPLGLLWFGGPSHEGILPRHGHGPQPQILDGRLIIEGVDMIRATDIYTGRLLWETPLEGVGDFFNNVNHQPGANASGSNYVSTPDGIYVAWKDRCVKLDPATGKILSEFPVPGGGPAEWSCISVAGDYLIGGSEPIIESVIVRQVQGGFDDPVAVIDPAVKRLASLTVGNDGRSSSRRLFVMDRKSGKVLWQASARSGFRHNSVCVGGGRLYVIDRLSGLQLDRLKKKGETNKTPPLLLAYDLNDGRELWRSEDSVFGTFLSYSEARDVLVESGRVARDTINDEPKDMRAWRAAEGKQIWKKGYSGPAMIHGDTILFGEQKACDLMTGAPRGRLDPITGQAVEWTWARNYGCNTPAASEHLLTFRSGAAGYFDLAGDGGTGNLGGFKSGCTNNLIVAGGLLNAPDYTRTCICSYQNQASLALVPMPEAEMWTFFGSSEIKGPVRRIGVNLGAPGDRRAEDGTLWVEHPSVGGKSYAAPLALDGKVEYFRRHSSRISGEGYPWVAASGVKGLESLTLTLNKNPKEDVSYLVNLTFVEPDALKPGERVFDVLLQGQVVLKDFDIVREAGGPDRGIVKPFQITASKDVRLQFVRHQSVPLLCGIEVVAGGELPAPRNVVHTDITVPEAPVLLHPRPEPADSAESMSLRALLWIGTGLLLFMYLFYRFQILRRRSP